MVIADNFSSLDWNTEGVRVIASAPINVIVYYPKTEQGKRELAERVAGIHADMANQYIKKLNCPSDQKVELLDAVIAFAKKGSTWASLTRIAFLIFFMV